MKRSNWHIWLVVIALAIRGLVPQGFMIGPADAAGLPTIVVCTPSGIKLVVAAPDGIPFEQQAPLPDEPPCLFASSIAAPLPEYARPPVPVRWIKVARFDERPLLVASATGHDWQARAPPWSGRLA